MTTKNRPKNSEKSAAPGQDDASKKSQKSGGATNGVSGPGPQGPRSGSCLGLLVNAVFYAAMIGAAGFAAFYLQQVVEEVRQIHAEYEENARRGAELGTKMENVLHQVS